MTELTLFSSLLRQYMKRPFTYGDAYRLATSEIAVARRYAVRNQRQGEDAIVTLANMLGVVGRRSGMSHRLLKI